MRFAPRLRCVNVALRGVASVVRCFEVPLMTSSSCLQQLWHRGLHLRVVLGGLPSPAVCVEEGSRFSIDRSLTRALHS
uniref:Uncharacterized protein n=1 Tax=Physcomitrium patens TaxID=3218 RepID=A0A2K1JGD3_PHYPA|nr:hypothetical protein PHYPA_018000 [Physcomitrium patens]